MYHHTSPWKYVMIIGKLSKSKSFIYYTYSVNKLSWLFTCRLPQLDIYVYNFMSYVIAESDILELMVIKLHNTFIQSWWHDSQCNERARGAFVHDGLELPSSCKREFIMIVFQHCSNELNIPETENILLGKCNKTLLYILEK